MNILIYANCQGIGIKHFLIKSKYIINNYKIKHIRIDELINKRLKLNIEKLKNADIFIYQYLDEKHGDICTKNILKYLKLDCKKISFAYIYNNSFYPIKGPETILDKFIHKKCTSIYDNSEVIINLINSGLSLEQIIDLYDKNQIDFNYSLRWDTTNNILEQKESNCDVKVLNFIKSNFNKQRLFLLENHPTSIIFIEIVNQILQILNLDKLNIQNYGLNDANINGYLPIDESSKKYFNLEYSSDDNSSLYYKKIINNIYNFYTQYELNK